MALREKTRRVGNRIIAGEEWRWFTHSLKVPGRAAKTDGGSWFRERNGEPQPGIRHEDRGMKTGHPERSYRNGHVSTAHLTNLSEHGIKQLHPRGDNQTAGRHRMGLGAETMPEGTKIGGDWFSDPNSTCRKHGSRSNARKAASAMIAKIPFPLAEYIGKAFLSANGSLAQGRRAAPQAKTETCY